MEIIYLRTCPYCKKEIQYKNKYIFNRQNKRNVLCRHCAKSNISEFTRNKMSDSQLGNTNKLGFKLSDEAKKHLSISKLGDKNPARQFDVRNKIRKSVNDMYELHPEIKKKISKATIKYQKLHPEALERLQNGWTNQYKDKYTDIEEIVKQILEHYNISYYHNKKIGKYWADFLIFSNVVIECDGEYWHKNVESDNIKSKYLINLGYNVYRFKGKEIHKNIEFVIETIQNISKQCNINVGEL